MKYQFILIFVAFTTLLSAQTSSKFFNSDVETNKKPWTNLDFQNDPNNFHFAIMSDNTGGNRPGIFKDAVNKLNLMRPEFVMSVGDLIQGYTTDTTQISKQWKEMNGIISGLDMPFFYLPGNHDITNKAMANEWEKRYGRRYYNFVYKNTLFVILDSNDDDDHNLTPEQTDFVLNTLNENKDVRWTFVFMHHPIWKYDTDGRFGKIETALKNRKHTVIAGHEHRYHHAEKDGSNYYILSTTGAGSALLGENFGLFDHVSWMTMTDDGPVMANLKLDGILPHDITNAKTMELANPLLTNTRMNNVILCNKGDKFEHATLYFSFKNPSKEDLQIDLNFFHHHQLQIPNSDVNVIVAAGEDKIVEIPLYSAKTIDYSAIDLLRFDWKMNYINSEYPDFSLQGKYQIIVKPGKIDYIHKNINVFVEDAQIEFNNKFPNLKVKYSLNKAAEKEYHNPIEISNASKFSFILENHKDEYSTAESRSFTKVTLQKASKVKKTNAGLKYKYYEGDWDSMPDFSQLTAKSEGMVHDFMVRDIAQREDNWALVYTGYIKIEEKGLKIFRVNSENDQCRFYINNKIVTDKNISIKGENVGAVLLKEGYHPIRIEYFEKENRQRLRFYTKTKEFNDWDFMEFDPFYY